LDRITGLCKLVEWDIQIIVKKRWKVRLLSGDFQMVYGSISWQRQPYQGGCSSWKIEQKNNELFIGCSYDECIRYNARPI
jgi:hypothetical protein